MSRVGMRINLHLVWISGAGEWGVWISGAGEWGVGSRDWVSKTRPLPTRCHAYRVR